MIANIVFAVFIFLSIWFGFVNVGSLIRKQSIPALNIIIMALGFTGAITHLIGLW